MKRDEAIQWIRDIRGEISRELHNDPREFVEFHKQLRAKFEARSTPAQPSSERIFRFRDKAKLDQK